MLRCVFRGPVTPSVLVTPLTCPARSSARFQTTNGIRADENGVSYPDNEPESGNYVRSGSYSYEWEGVTYTVTWQADENGFFAEGDHLP